MTVWRWVLQASRRSARRSSLPAHGRREREILENTVHTIAEQAAKADDLVDEAKAAGGGNHPVTIHAKMRLELLKVKADLERELGNFSLICSKYRLYLPLANESVASAILRSASPREG